MYLRSGLFRAEDSREQRRARLRRGGGERGQVADYGVEELGATARRHAANEQHICAHARIHRLNAPGNEASTLIRRLLSSILARCSWKRQGASLTGR